MFCYMPTIVMQFHVVFFYQCFFVFVLFWFFWGGSVGRLHIIYTDILHLCVRGFSYEWYLEMLIGQSKYQNYDKCKYKMLKSVLISAVWLI